MKTTGKINADRSSKTGKKSSPTASDIEQKYQALFEQSPYGILLIDTEGKILDFNETAHRNLGYTREEFANITIADIDPFESAVDVKARISRILEKGSAEFEVRHRTKQGEIRDVHVVIKALTLSGKTLLHAIWRDITDRKSTENAVELFRNLLNRSNEAIFVNHPKTGRFLDANDRACASLRYDREELLGMGVMDIEASLPDNFLWQGHVSEVRQKGSLLLEGIHRRKDGTTFPVEANVSYVSLDSGEYMIAAVRDITVRRRAEEALKESEERLRQAIRVSQGGIFDHDHLTNSIYWSPRQREIHGWGPDEPITLSDFLNLVHPEDIESISAAIRRAHDPAGDGVWDVEHRIIRRDGTICWLMARSQTFFEGEGDARHPVRTVGAVLDITDRKQVEEKVRQSERFIRNILDTVDEGFIVLDRDFRILTANKAYCSQVGKSCDSVIGRHCYEISHNTLRPCHEEGEDCAVRHVFEKGEPHTALHKHPDAKGSILYFEMKAFPIKDSTGAVTSAIETINNITEKHLLEAEQLKTQKLEAIGTLAGGIAHDFNNLLQGVFGYISMAKMTLDQKEQSLTMLEQAEKALHMSVNLTTQLLTFSKGGKPMKKKIQLKAVIENSVRFALSGSNVDFRTEFDDNLWAVDADEGQIGQVIQNIVLNADQAMPVGGTIVIAVRNVSAPHKGLTSLLAEGQYIEISVKDNGIGIPEQYLPRLFDPYFTTKEKGSGLGLATSYSIIKNHGGLIDVKSELGEGSTFFVYLPAIEAKEERVGTIPATGKDVRRGRVLVMDDEELIRNIMGIMLRTLGHEAEFAENSEEAIAKYREALSSGRRFDIVILDLTIRGGVGGEETLRELIALDPEVKAVVSSGYSDSAAISEYESRGFSACLVKPYEVGVLRDILNVLLK